jgi:hypothetical protein
MATARALRLVLTSSSVPAAKDGFLVAARRRLLSASTEAGGAGDAAVQSGDAPSDDYTDRPPRFSGAEEATSAGGRVGKHPGGKAAERVPPFAPSGKKPPLAGSEHELADPAGAASSTQSDGCAPPPHRGSGSRARP